MTLIRAAALADLTPGAPHLVETDGTRLACPWHGFMYNVRTGQCLLATRGAAVPSYPARIDGDAVWVDIS